MNIIWIVGAGLVVLWLAFRKVQPTATPSNLAAQNADVQLAAPTTATSSSPIPGPVNPTGGTTAAVPGATSSADSIVHVNQYIIDPGGGSGPFHILSVGNGPLLLKAFLALNVSGTAITGISALVGNRVQVPDGSILRNLAATTGFPSGGQEYVVVEGRLKRQ